MSWLFLLLATVTAAVWQGLDGSVWLARPDFLLLVTMAVAWRKGLVSGCLIGAFSGILLGAGRQAMVLPMMLLYLGVAVLTAVRAYKGVAWELPLLGVVATVWLACSDYLLAFGHGLSFQVGAFQVLQIGLLHALLLVPLSLKPCAMAVGEH